VSGDPTDRQSADASSPSQVPVPIVLSPAAVKRVRWLLLFFSVLLVLWIAAMIEMYATTVYPQRHPAHGTPRSSTE